MKISITYQFVQAIYQRQTVSAVAIHHFPIPRYKFAFNLYNDNWEWDNRRFGFALMQLGIPDLVDKYDIANKLSNGTKYEEARCEEIEVLFWLSGKTKENDPFDWSFDPLTLIQGKQWK